MVEVELFDGEDEVDVFDGEDEVEVFEEVVDGTMISSGPGVSTRVAVFRIVFVLTAVDDLPTVVVYSLCGDPSASLLERKSGRGRTVQVVEVTRVTTSGSSTETTWVAVLRMVFVRRAVVVGSVVVYSRCLEGQRRSSTNGGAGVPSTWLMIHGY